MCEYDVIKLMETQRLQHGTILFSIHHLADVSGLTTYQVRGHLDNLFRAGVVDKIPGEFDAPALWFLT